MYEDQKVSTIGIILKSIFGIVIVFSIAIPRVLTGEMFFTGILGFLTLVILGIVWYILFNMLKVDRGSIVNLVIYMMTCALLGLFFSNSILVTVYYVNVFSNSSVDIAMVMQALLITTFATLIAVFGGIIMLPKIKLDGKVAKFGKNFIVILASITIGWTLLYAIGFVLSVFGATSLLYALYQMMFGIGYFSIALSVIMVLFAGFLFLASAARVRMMIGTEDKHLEYFGSMILVNAIVQIFVEIFKLVLKILARNNRR